jgi:hypothetical protein
VGQKLRLGRLILLRKEENGWAAIGKIKRETGMGSNKILGRIENEKG